MQVYVVRDKTFSYSGVFDLREFIDYIKGWFEKYDYDVIEKEYVDKSVDIKSTTIKWECDRKIDDYHQYFLDVKIKVDNYQEIKKDGKQMVKGEFSFSFDAYIEKDYLETWKKSPGKRFARAVFDRFVMEQKETDVEKQLKDDSEDLFSEVKKYFH